MSTGCLQYRTNVAGIAHCLDSSAAVGTVFPIAFTAFDSAGLKGSATRVVTIAEPCAEGERWCPEDDPNGKCEAVTCAAAAELAALAAGARTNTSVGLRRPRGLSLGRPLLHGRRALGTRC